MVVRRYGFLDVYVGMLEYCQRHELGCPSPVLELLSPGLQVTWISHMDLDL